MRKEPEHAEAVGDRDHHRALSREPMTVVVRLVGPAAAVAATVEEHHHRQRTLAPLPRRPDIEIQAVLADGEVGEHRALGAETLGHAAIPVEDAHALHAGGRERRGRTGHAPAHEVHGRAPTQSADGRLSERQAEVGVDARRGRRCPDHRLAVDLQTGRPGRRGRRVRRDRTATEHQQTGQPPGYPKHRASHGWKPPPLPRDPQL